MKTITTVHPANKQELSKMLKGMSLSELLNDLVLVNHYIKPLNERVEELDKMYSLTNDSMCEDEANRIDEKLLQLDYYFGRLNKTLNRTINKMPEDDFVDLVDDLDKESKAVTPKGKKTKIAKLASTYLSIIYDNIGMEYIQAA